MRAAPLSSLLLALAFVTGCGERKIEGDCEGMCEPYGPASPIPEVGTCQQGMCTPTFGECITRDEIDTCAEACAEQGSVCVENGCAGATYLIYLVLPICEDISMEPGVDIAHSCDEPIDWQFSQSVRCCCAQ